MAHTYLYIPYLDERAAGMQRFSTEMVLALRRAGGAPRVIVGEIQGRPPAWLEGMPHSVVLGPWWAARLPRPLAALARVAWVQVIFPVVAGRGATLVALGHELAPLPLVRQVAVVHDLTDFKAFAGRGGLGTRLRNRLWRAGLSRSVALVSISEATRHDLAATFGIAGDHVHVVYEGVDRARFAPAPARAADGRRPFLLYVGTLDPHKNVSFLLSVYEEIVARGHGVELVLAGRYRPEEAEALDAQASAPARAGLRWRGFVGDDELADLMGECLAFVFPSRNEGFGLAAAEAMACGAPVVSSDGGSLAEVVGDGGVLLSPDDRAGWTGTLERILTDADYRAQLSARALARSEAFSWDRAAAAYRALIDSAPL